jgi:zinc protease
MLESSKLKENNKHNLLKHQTLSNGCEVYLEQVDFAPLVTLQLWVKAGSLDERPQEFGMAHVLEHMLFKGTTTHPKTGDVAKLVEAAGGEINAYTTFDHTVYYINAPREFAFEGAELLFDVVCSSLLDENELNRELEVVIEEIRRGRDNPSARLSHTLFSKLYEGHPQGRPVIGYEEVVKQFNRNSLVDFYKRWYTPANMIFIAAGDFQLDLMTQKLDELCARYKTSPLPDRVWKPAHEWPNKPEPQVEVLYGPYQETRLQFTTPAPVLEDALTPAWEMYASILGHGDSSRLTHNVKDEAQLVTAIDSSLYTPRFPFGFTGFGFFGRSETANDAVTAALSEILRLAHDGPTDAEVKRVLTVAKAEKVYGQESVEGLVRNVGNNLLTEAKLEFDTLFFERLAKVTSSQVQRCAQIVIDNVLQNKVICVAVANQEHKSNVSAESLSNTLKAWQNSLNQPSHRTSHPSLQKLLSKSSKQTSNRNQSIEHTRLELADSSSHLHFNSRVSNRLPIVSHALVWRWGLHQEPSEKSGLNALLAQMLTRGTERHTYRQFVTELEDMGASISAFSSRDLFGLRLDCLSDVQPKALQMMLDCLVRPAFTQEQFDKVVRETEEVLVAQRDNAGSRLSRVNAPLLFGQHAYARPLLGQIETLKTIDLDDVERQWNRLLLTQSFVFSGAGQYNSDQTFASVAEELIQVSAQHKTRSKNFSAIAEGESVEPLTRQARIGFDVLDREQAHISLSLRSMPLSDMRRTALEVASSVLGGQGGRLFMDLRDAQSLAYSVGCSQSPGLWAGSFGCYIATAADKAQQALGGLKHHLEHIAKIPPSVEELSRAKNTLLGGQSLESQHHHYQASQLAMSDVFGLGFDNFLTFRERIEAVSAEQVSSVIRDLLETGAPVIGMIGPEKTWVPQCDDALLTEWNI